MVAQYAALVLVVQEFKEQIVFLAQEIHITVK